MRAVLPGKPEAKLQAVCTGKWDGRRVIAYISGTSLVILGGVDRILQTIYHDDGLELEAVAFDEEFGKIAVCHDSTVLVYRPYGKDEGALKWSLQCSLSISNIDETAATLSWGTSQDVLVGSSSLDLFTTTEPEALLWSRKLANAAKFAQFSHDATLVASTGHYDRLLKIWRRLSFGSDDVRFDVTYLAHPSTVTGIHWKRPYHREQAIENVLYTLCADNVLRIWAATDPHGLQVLQLWGKVDLQESIKPRLSAAPEDSNKRYAFIIDSHDFSIATERAVQKADGAKQEHNALDHLIEVAQRGPEVCVVLDEKGGMSAWGLENVGCKARKTTNIFNIVHIDGLESSLALKDEGSMDSYIQFHTFCGGENESAFVILAHHFDGRIHWMETQVDDLFDPSSRRSRLKPRASWSGHSGPIKKISRTASGNAILSRTDANECLLWKHRVTRDGTDMRRHSTIQVSDHIHRVCVLGEGDFVVFLHHDCISLWDTRTPCSHQIAQCTYHLEAKPLCLILLPETEKSSKVVHVATIGSEMKGIAWEIHLPLQISDANVPNGEVVSTGLKEFCKFDLGMKDNLDFVLPVDPAGSPAVVSGFMDIFARDIALSYTTLGVLRSWTAKVDREKSKVDWLLTSTVETGMNSPSLASGSSIRKTALVDSSKTRLTIWDTQGAQLEFDQRFEAQDAIQDLDWTSTPDEQSILAVGFPHRILLLSQLRFDYLDAGPAWASVREIRIRELTPYPIGDSVWLGGGNLVIGAGNQLFVCDKTTELGDLLVSDLRLPSHEQVAKDLFNIVTRLNGPLPVFHPQFLAQCILCGKGQIVQKILINLHKCLKFFSQGDELDSSLGLSLEEFFTDEKATFNPARKELQSSYADFADAENEDFTEMLAASLNENLTTLAIPQLSSQEQLHLVDIVECVATVEKHRRSMDDNASRFLLFFRQHMLRMDRAATKLANISWREVLWAFHSNSQDILVDMVSRQYQAKMSWKHSRESGLFMWIKDITAVRAQFEVIARNQYTMTEDKNPVDCSLYYLALRKKKVLLNLWRMAGWNREQRSTQRLLSNDFSEPRWKTAALKNAYTLLGRHRFEYAAAFFLLADRLKDAVNVCITQLHDIQLAITIARVYEGDDGPVLRELLEDTILRRAAGEGDRWLASWAFWMLNRRDMAVRALISPIHTLLERPPSPGMQSKSYLANDPALVVLYKQLREKTLQTLKGASKVLPRAEWDFIMHNARLYDRMGCDVLALDLVRNWEFLQQSVEKTKTATDVPDPRAMLRRRSSLVVADLPSPKSPKDTKFEASKQPASLFEEPTMDSLLDNFGF
ncbi:MAG: regulator of (H+)-ATPase in vacuolar membrane [Sclerophora amabilis]|nr:MAG: regulator of (H+)-ATPase in vacuolar membrane [Sclerophora amabilis]